jgi:hypothetical protein
MKNSIDKSNMIMILIGNINLVILLLYLLGIFKINIFIDTILILAILTVNNLFLKKYLKIDLRTMIKNNLKNFLYLIFFPLAMYFVIIEVFNYQNEWILFDRDPGIFSLGPTLYENFGAPKVNFLNSILEPIPGNVLTLPHGIFNYEFENPQMINPSTNLEQDVLQVGTVGGYLHGLPTFNFIILELRELFRISSPLNNNLYLVISSLAILTLILFITTHLRHKVSIVLVINFLISIPFIYVYIHTFTETLSLIVILSSLIFTYTGYKFDQLYLKILGLIVMLFNSIVRIDGTLILAFLVILPVIIEYRREKPRIKQTLLIINLGLIHFLLIKINYTLAPKYYVDTLQWTSKLNIILLITIIISNILILKSDIKKFNEQIEKTIYFALIFLPILITLLYFRGQRLINNDPLKAENYSGIGIDIILRYYGFPILLLFLFFQFCLISKRLIKYTQFTYFDKIYYSGLSILIYIPYLINIAIYPDLPWASRRLIYFILPVYLLMSYQSITIIFKSIEKLFKFKIRIFVAKLILISLLMLQHALLNYKEIKNVLENEMWQGLYKSMNNTCLEQNDSKINGLYVINKYDSLDHAFMGSFRALCGMEIVGINGVDNKILNWFEYLKSKGISIYWLEADPNKSFKTYFYNNDYSKNANILIEGVGRGYSVNGAEIKIQASGSLYSEEVDDSGAKWNWVNEGETVLQIFNMGKIRNVNVSFGLRMAPCINGSVIFDINSNLGKMEVLLSKELYNYSNLYELPSFELLEIKISPQRDIRSCTTSNDIRKLTYQISKIEIR